MNGPHEQGAQAAAGSVAFVGVGAIGLPKALRIAGAGHRVTAVDASPERRGLAEQAGLASTGALVDVQADVTVVMVATPQQLSEVTAAASLAAGSVCVVMSTVGPAAVRAAAHQLHGQGVAVLDVPVTGGVAGATAGRLTLFAAGDPEVLERVRPLLTPLGTVHDCGREIGDGQAIKVVNQLLCSVNLVAAAEALAFAGALGLEPARVLELVRAGSGGSWMLGDRGPRMLEGTDVEVTSAVDLFVKDSTLVTEAAADAGFDAPLVRLAAERFRAAAERGLGRRDDSRVIETYDEPERDLTTPP